MNPIVLCLVAVAAIVIVVMFVMRKRGTRP
jgi:hypothetical protein